MKRSILIISVCLSLLLSGCGLYSPFSLAPSLAEADNSGKSTNTQREYETYRIFDYGYELDDAEELAVEEYIHRAEEATTCDIVFVTLRRSLKDYVEKYRENYDYEITPDLYTMVYAENFWVENNFGYNTPDGDGIIIVDNIYREDETGRIYTYLMTFGRVAETLSSEAVDRILDAFYVNIDSDYSQACMDCVDCFMLEMGLGKATIDSFDISEIAESNETANTTPSSSKTYADDRVADIDKILQEADINNCKTIKYDLMSYDGMYTYTCSYAYNTDVYNYYHGLNRYYATLDYNHYINDEFNSEYIRSLLEMLDEVWTEMEYTDSDKVREAVNFVQSIDYLDDKSSAGKDEWPKYAIETLYEQNGDCEDLSILLAGMLKEMGYGCCLLVFDGHVAVGLRCDDTMSGYYYEKDGNKYLYVETTALGWQIGEVPDEFYGSDATVIPIF